jgi:ferredoxin-NADP reductase
MAPDSARFELVAPDGGELPPFDAGAHIDVVIAPEYLRQYSLAGDPADRTRYVLGVQAEASGRGGSKLMHRAFRAGRRVFVSAPRNHFPLVEDATRSLLFAGGIGVTPLLAMAHRLHALEKPFEFHYSFRSRDSASFLADIEAAPWRAHVALHVTTEGSRADFSRLVPRYEPGFHLYACGAARFMDAVFDAAHAKGWPDEALHKEYFSVPEPPDYVNHPFVLRLARSGRAVEVPAGLRATEALAAVGIVVDTKCSDGICGVCATPYTAGEVEHRDYVLSARERSHKMVLCCSRAKAAGGEIVLDL